MIGKKGGRMTERAGIKIPILIVLLIISLSLAGGIFYLLDKEQAKNLALQGELEETRAKYMKSESELQGANKRISTLDLELTEAESKIEAINNELGQEKIIRQEALAQIGQLKVDLEEQRGQKLDLEKQLNQAQDEAKKTKEQLDQLVSQKVDLESKIKELETKFQGVELGKIVVNPETGAVEAETQEAAEGLLKPEDGKSKKNIQAQTAQGKVLVINKDYNFVVINLGSKDGVEIGEVFSIYRNNKYIGEVKVEKVHDSMSAAGFLSTEIKGKIREGDKAVQRIE